MTPILNASIQGYTAAQIISFLSNLYPALSPKIKKAKQAGYGVDQILDFVSKTMEGGKASPHLTQSELEAEKMARQSGLTKDILKGAFTTGVGALGLSALRQMLPQNPQVGTPPIQPAPNPPAGPQAPPLPVQPTPNPMPPIGPAMGATVPQPPPPINPTTPPPAQPLTPAPTAPQVAAPQQLGNASSILEQFGLRGIAEKLRLQGKDPEIISAVLNHHLKGENRQKFGEMLKSGQIPPFNELIKQFISESPPAKVMKLPPGQENKYGGLLEPVDAPIIKPEDYQVPEENRPPIKTGSIVIKPDGSIGEVKGKDKSGLLVDEGGKAKSIPEDELEQEPEDVISITQNLLKIPEVDRSSVVSLFTYDPSDRDMFIQYHNGETYRYKDVDPEKVMNVANKMGIPVTEGQNIFGAWSPEDKKSIGATLIQEFLKDPKYAKPKKGEPANPNYRKLETFYDYWEKLRRKPKKKKL